MKYNAVDMTLEELQKYIGSFVATNDIVTVTFTKKLTTKMIDEVVEKVLVTTPVSRIAKAIKHELKETIKRQYKGRITSYNATNNTYNLELTDGRFKSIKRDSIMFFTVNATGTIVRRK